MTTTRIQPAWAGTIAILGACVGGWVLNGQAETAYGAARAVGFCLLAAITFSFLMDWRLGLRNLVRSDVFALLALYFLLYFEFLFPQPNFEIYAVFEDVRTSINLTLIGFAALALGRHFSFGSGHPLDFVGNIRLQTRDYVWLLLAAFIACNLSQWMAVGFNMVDWIKELLESRFQRDWARGRYGDASALLSELSLLGYIIPPIAGLILAKRKEVNVFSLLLVVLCLLLMFFKGFSGGTRNVLAVYMVGLVGGYFLVQKQLKVKTLAVAGLIVMLSFFFLAKYMLEFRNIGLGRYIEEGRYKTSYRSFHMQYQGGYADTKETYFVDYNLHTMSRLVAVFPVQFDYIGWNLPFVALTKPIPRVLWPSKPDGLKVGLEEAIGAEGMTVAATFIGEAYISFGIIGVAAAGLLLGTFCGWWNHLALQLHSPLALIIYTSGFYAILITMRSLMFFTTAILPALALIVLARFLHAHQHPG